MTARITCLILSLAATPALAQPMGPPPGGPPGVGGPGPRQQMFISPAGEPFRAAPDTPYPVSDWFTRADTDDDGGLTLAEFTTDSLAFFDRLDANHDRFIDGFENSAYEKTVVPEILAVDAGPDGDGPMAGGPPPGGRGGGGPPPGGGRGAPSGGGPPGGGMGGPPTSGGGHGGNPRDALPRRQGAGPWALLNEPQPVRGADANLDQRVARAEAEATAKVRFTRLDRDADGRLTLAELPRTPEQLASEQRGRDPRRKGPPPR